MLSSHVFSLLCSNAGIIAPHQGWFWSPSCTIGSIIIITVAYGRSRHHLLTSMKNCKKAKKSKEEKKKKKKTTGGFE